MTPSAGASASPSRTSARPPKTEATKAPPSRGSFPGAGNTGVPAGAKLKAPSSTVLRVQKAGTVINGVDIRADISVEANNVTIKNSRVITAGEWGIIQRANVSGLVVQDSEIRGDGSARLQHGIFNLGGNITVLRTEVSKVTDAITTSAGLIQDNYLHDPAYFDGDHTDMIESDSGPGSGQQLVIRRNTVVNTLDQTSAVALYQDFGVQHDTIIEDNLLAGGGYALYGGAGDKGSAYNVKVVGNVFSREVHPQSGQFGPVAHWDEHGSGNEWRDNVWADTGRPITP
ncbi:hypothetical protein ACQPZX_15280 [Actinoplanes sp. CA-142083]|uniref:hypothetical protein n=1 Tax=Actinoplanes sp. CA-142083 TaxID=3239903 RepID=UPI003D8C33A2